MSFKYYDLLSNLTVGVVVFYAVLKLYFCVEDISELVILAGGYVTGYFLNAISGFMEPFLQWTIGGKPSDHLLSPIREIDWTGIKKVKFYYADEAIELLTIDAKADSSDKGKLFDYAKHRAILCKDCRVPDFNNHYSLSRVIFATVILGVVVAEIEYYDVWYSWLISAVALFLAWNRFRERGYYYAREVLNEYLKSKRIAISHDKN